MSKRINMDAIMTRSVKEWLINESFKEVKQRFFLKEEKK
jgi:hypothetical protein